jgi:hypothetical protein
MALSCCLDVNAARIRFQEALEYRGSVHREEARCNDVEEVFPGWASGWAWLKLSSRMGSAV